jgi:hypothetical protein
MNSEDYAEFLYFHLEKFEEVNGKIYDNNKMMRYLSEREDEHNDGIRKYYDSISVD